MSQMKTVRDLVDRYVQVKHNIHRLQRECEQLKELAHNLHDNGVRLVGTAAYLTVSQQTRTDPDRDRIREEMGEAWLLERSNTVEFQRIDIKARVVRAKVPTRSLKRALKEFNKPL